jgi:small conductance mechanosensitive channel
MLLTSILLQLTKIVPDSATVVTPQAVESKLKSFSFDEFFSSSIHTVINFGFRILLAIAVFYIGKFIINKLYKITRTLMIRRSFDRSLATFILSLLKITLLFILVVSVIGILGIETSSFIAIFASAGVAIGMALSGTLQNFAGGVLILFIKPYKIGDFIEYGSYSGFVKEIQIFNTIINTLDNKSIIIPNGGLSTGTINNYSREEYRGLEWKIGISYGDDIDVARATALDIIHADSRIVKRYREDDKRHHKAVIDAAKTDAEKNAEIAKTEEEPEEEKHSWLYSFIHRRRELKKKAEIWQEQRNEELLAKIPKKDCTPTVSVAELGDSAIVLVIRAWTRSENYWSVYYSINEQIYKEFPKHGLSFPFPQMDVHVDHQS